MYSFNFVLPQTKPQYIMLFPVAGTRIVGRTLEKT